MNEEKSAVIDFGTGSPERWQHPEIGNPLLEEMNKEIEFWKKNGVPSYEPITRRDYSQRYKAAIVQQYLDKNPQASVLSPSNEEDDDIKDETIRRVFKLKPNDEITKSHHNWYEGYRLYNGVINDEDEPIVHRIDEQYNPAVIKENKEWEESAKKAVPTPSKEYKPMFQNTSPSRMTMFRNTPQVIDPSLPIYLQTANPYIPWGKDHPLMALWRQKVGSMRTNSIEDEFEQEKQLRVMDELNNPSNLYQSMFMRDNVPFSSHKNIVEQVDKTGWTPSMLHQQRQEMQSVLKHIYNK